MFFFVPKQASRRVDDLFEDLRDGHNLLSLLEVLSGEHLVSIQCIQIPVHVKEKIKILSTNSTFVYFFLHVSLATRKGKNAFSHAPKCSNGSRFSAIQEN